MGDEWVCMGWSVEMEAWGRLWGGLRVDGKEGGWEGKI